MQINLTWYKALFILIILFIILYVLLSSDENKNIQPDRHQDILPGLLNDVDKIYENQIPNTQQDIPTNKPKLIKSYSENMTAEVFTELIRSYGGNVNDIQYNVRLPEIINPETGRRLELDVYYQYGNIKIGVEYNGMQHYIFPNKFHPNTEKGRKDFDAQLRRDAYKLKCCELNGIYLIRVPYTIDICNPDNNVTGYKYDPKITKEERKLRLHKFIKHHIDNYLNSFK